MIKCDFKLWCFLERSQSSTNKNKPFFWPTKGNNICVIPNDCHKEVGVFKHLKTFWHPLIWLPPKRLVWIRQW